MMLVPEPLENKIIIKQMSLEDINTMIDTLNTMKSEIKENIKNYNMAVKEHVPSEAELDGRVGTHFSEEYKIARASISYENIFHKKTIEFESNSAISISVHDEMKLLQTKIDKIFDFKEEEVDFTLEPDEITITKNYALHDSVQEVVPNLKKAKYLITQMYLSDSDELIDANVNWQPCGGTSVAKVIGRYFLVEMNIDGLEIKEISKTFYDSFVNEFSNEKESKSCLKRQDLFDL